MSNHVKLYIPGPVEVSAKTYEAMCRPMIGHRSKDFQNLYAGIQPRLQEMFATTQPVFISTSSAWGIMEGAVRNLVGDGKVLNCMCGAFSDKWFDVSQRCGKQAVACQVEWGSPITPDLLRQHLDQGGFDAVTLVHNETSTGLMNPLEDLCEVLREYPEVSLIVDTVSSFSVVPIEFDKLGIDLLLTGSQKALALPPGMALFTVSEAAFQRAERQSDRGYYFDLLEFRKNQEKNMTPSTPVIPHIHALESKLEEIFTEGLDNRYARHEQLNRMVHDWVRRHGFAFFAAEGCRSKSLTCVANNKGIDVARLVSLMRENHAIAIDGGYGKIKGETFRISNMGDESPESIQIVLDALDDCLQKL